MAKQFGSNCEEQSAGLAQEGTADHVTQPDKELTLGISSSAIQLQQPGNSTAAHGSEIWLSDSSEIRDSDQEVECVLLHETQAQNVASSTGHGTSAGCTNVTATSAMLMWTHYFAVRHGPQWGFGPYAHVQLTDQCMPGHP